MFLVQSSAMEFLSSHDFDFNHLMKTGINYLNKNDENMVGIHTGYVNLRSSLKPRNGSMIDTVEPMTHLEEDAICTELKRIAAWQSSDKPDNAILDGEVYSYKQRVIDILVDKINTAFPSVVVTVQEDEMSGEKVCVYHESNANMREQLLNKKRGFTRMFYLLSELKKPFVGHNLLLDLMIMYNQLYKPLPDSYAEFKKSLHVLFPHIYDTKYMSYELRENVSKLLMWESNDLSQLYLYFHVGNGKQITQHCSQVELVNATDNTPIFHEAGWDSYYTGYCFIKIMHFYALQINRAGGMDPRPLTSVQHLHSVLAFKNRINISRANVNHLCLDGPEPSSVKPPWIVVSLKPGSNISTQCLLDNVVSQGNLSMDVKLLSENSVMIAVNSMSASRAVFKMFTDNADYQAATYNRFKHSPRIRAFLWCGVLISTTSVSAYLVYKHWPSITQLH